jgi:hypothetical protein
MTGFQLKESKQLGRTTGGKQQANPLRRRTKKLGAFWCRTDGEHLMAGRGQDRRLTAAEGTKVYMGGNKKKMKSSTVVVTEKSSLVGKE